jgi:hypothetical protein
MEVLRTVVRNHNHYSTTAVELDKVTSYLRTYYSLGYHKCLDFGMPDRMLNCSVWLFLPLRGWIYKGVRTWKF